ncbi:FRG domain-containing protein [Roseibium sp. Sym1]|uniref:FRG domain-containing protein n=1 Tax=Roseibium sp. Sym1 TaxID=3016006 RepID=UPI0022B3F331|nr:FRG domain-containing protein [Roseibium sp. Sym1]
MFKPILTRAGLPTAVNEISLDKFLNGCLLGCEEKFVFRGQADSTWRLVPSGFRTSTGDIASETERNSRIRMFQSDDFLAECKELRMILKERENVRSLKGADYKRLQLMVIAQHFGVPTPLLDWTKSPLIAAYMATNFRRSPGVIGIYRLDRSTNPDDVIFTDYSEVSFNRIRSQLGGVSCFGKMDAGNLQLSTDTFEQYLQDKKSEIRSGSLDCFISKVDVRIEASDFSRLKEVLRSNGILTDLLFPRSGYWKAQSIREAFSL